MKKKMQAKTEETAEQKQEQRCYSQYAKNETLDFDPLKELNLPANYEEVLARFQKLQGERAMESRTDSTQSISKRPVATGRFAFEYVLSAFPVNTAP